MSAPFMTLLAMAALAVGYVLAPIAVGAYRRFRGRRTVGCPETGLAAEVKLDARHAALTALGGTPRVRVAECSFWPERKGCAQHCVAQAAR